MSKIISLSQAYDQFQEVLDECYGIDGDDEIAMCEAWNDYTDSLCKDGYLTGLQYSYAPGYGEDMPDDLEEDFSYILESMGFDFSSWNEQDKNGRFCCLIKRHDAEYKLLASDHMDISDTMRAVLEDKKALAKLKITASEAEELEELLEAIP